MRFLNELIRKTKAAHVDVGLPAGSDEAEPLVPGEAPREVAELELPHLRRPSSFEHFAANRRSDKEDLFAASETARDASDEDPLPRSAPPETAASHEIHEEPDDESAARQAGPDVIFARQAFRHEEHGGDASEEAVAPGNGEEMIAMDAGQNDPMLADEIEQEDIQFEQVSEVITFEEERNEPLEFSEAPTVPDEEDLEAPTIAASRVPLRRQEETEPFDAPLPDWSAPSGVSAPEPAEAVSRVNIWDIEETGEDDEEFGKEFSEASANSAPEIPPTVQEAPTQQRRSGRVRTRLLGFQRPDELSADPFARSAGNVAANAEPTFPVGWMVVAKGPGRGAFFPLFTGVSKIGRGEDQAVRLDFGDMSVSRDSHAVVAYDDEQRAFFVGHSGKSNPVRLNGMPVLSTEPFKDGDSLRIGETTLRLVALCGSDFDWNDENEQGERNVAAR